MAKNKIDKHIENIIINLLCSNKKKKDLKLQFTDHLNS